MDAAGPTSPYWGADVAPRLTPSRSGSSSLLDGQDLTVNSAGRGNGKGAIGSIGPIGGHRGFNAANRATSPALSANGGLLGGGDSQQFLGASYHSFRAANSSSPSFVSAFTHQQGPSEGPSDVNGLSGARAGTPRLVLESAEGATKEVAAEGEEAAASNNMVSPVGSDQGQANEAGATPRMNDEQPNFAALPRDDSGRDLATPVSATSDSSGIGAGYLGGFGRSQSPSTHSQTGMTSSMSEATAHPSYPFPAVSRPTALNAATLAHNSALAGFPAGFPGAGFLGPPSAGVGQDPTSPTAATAGGAHSATFSPFGSPSKMTLSLQSFTAAAAARQQRSPQPHQPPSCSGSGSTHGIDESSATAGAPSTSFDAQLRASPLINDLIDRLVRLELSVKDVNRHVGGINRNVSILLDRTKHLQSGGSGAGNAAGANGSSTTGDDIRLLSSQVNTLTSSVAQLLALQASNAGLASPVAPQPIHQQLAGLGLGAAGTPQLGTNITTPSLGTLPGTPGLPGGFSRINNPPFDRSASPGLRGSSFSAYGHDPQGRLSPRPGGSVTSPNPQARLSWGGGAPKDLDVRRWNNASGAGSRREGGASGVRGTPDVDGGRFGAGGSSIQGVPNGAMAPPDPSVIVTKWDHLNLHPDLLRSILKYGLGPPNKIQQRALPFLLRGSDIIAQAPPTQERIASYVIPALQVVLNVLRGEPIPNRTPGRGPIVIMISTTVDQATQAQRMALGLGANLGVRVHIAAAGSIDVAQEAAALVQAQPHIVIGTPQKMSDLFTFLANRAGGAISLGDVRLAILDEVDQLIARNLADYVSTLLRLLPPPRVALAAASGRASLSAPSQGIDGLPKSPTLPPGLPMSGGAGGIFAGFESDPASPDAATVTIDRQTAIFSNTVPQDVLNFAQSIHLRESVRVLVRRDGNAGQPQVSYGSAPTASSGGGHSVGGGGGAGSVLSPNLSGPGQYGSSIGLHGQPANALGASPANNNSNPLADPMLAALRGLRQYYVYVAVSTGGANGLTSPNPMSAGSAIAHAVEMKLDVITDLLEDIDFGQAVIYTSSSSTLEAVTYKLASKGVDALALHKEMAHTTRQQVLSKFRSSSGPVSGFQQASQMVVGGPGGGSGSGAVGGRGARKALVVYDVAINPRDVHQVPLIVFYDLPRSVDDYKEKLSCAAAGGIGRPSVCVNVVTGSGGPRGDIEMLRTLECHLGCKMAELPMNPSQILQF